jgi:GNAT superfamily N-acetyltransferase
MAGLTPGEAPQALQVSVAQEEDAAELASLHAAVAQDLTDRYGKGPWSSSPSERSVLWAIKSSRVLAGRLDGAIVATLQLQTRKPWALDRSYFTEVARPLYLVDMAVAPTMQRRGLGRRLMHEAVTVGRAWPAGSLCLDAYDAQAGAGPFYDKCGFREAGRAIYRGTPLIYYELLL